jgi:hypothetical protein
VATVATLHLSSMPSKRSLLCQRAFASEAADDDPPKEQSGGG